MFGIGVSNQLSRNPGFSSTLVAAQVASTCVLGLGLGQIAAIFAAAGYRPQRDPAIIQLGSDLGWLVYLSSGSPMILQALCTSWAIL